MRQRLDRFIALAGLALAAAALFPTRAVATAPSGYLFHTVPSCRLYDSRSTTPVAHEVPRLIDVEGECLVPEEAVAISFNLTAVAPTAAGRLTIYAGDTPPPANVSTMNFPAGVTRATNGIVTLSTSLATDSVAVNPFFGGGSGSVHVVLDVTGYFAPGAIAHPDSATVTEDASPTTILVTANDDPAGAEPLVIESVTQPANGTVVITNAGADLTYEPDPDYCNDPPGGAPDTFGYTLVNGTSTTVDVTVTCVDDPMAAVDDAATVAEDSAATPIDVLANDTDIDGPTPTTIQSVTQPANGTVVITGGGTGLTYQPDADYCNAPVPPGTADTFTYTLDPGGSTATVSVTVTCDDDSPTAVDDAATVAEDSGANTIDVLANDTDIDGGPIAVQSVTQPANGTVAITNGGADLTYTPDANYCNAPPATTLDTFTYTLVPGGSSATVTVTVTCVDDPPVAVADAATVVEDSGANTVNVLANDTDIDGGPIAIQSVTQPTNGAVAITNAGADLTYTPNADYCNNPPGTTLDTFTYTLDGGSSTTVTMTVTCVNDGPRVDLDADDDKGTAGNDFAATFTEGDPATLIQDADDPLGAVVTDVDSATLASLTVTITNLLDAGQETLSADVTGTSVTANYVAATGVLTLTGPDTLASFTTVLRTVRYDNGSNAPDTTPRLVHFVGNDGSDDGNTAVSTVTVVGVDSDPTAVADTATVDEDSGANAIDVLANDTDPDGGPISITSVTQPANGTVVITGGGTGLTYAPDANYCGPDSFTYTLSPGGSVATVTMTVTCIDDPPVAVADAATVNEDSGANAIPVLANDTDPDGGPISITSVTQPANGAVVITGGGTGLTYAPNANYCNDPPGTTLDTFTYTLTPGGSSTTVTVTVTCVDDSPVAVADAATVVEDSTNNAIDVLANDTDVDGGPISVTSVTQPANGTVAITGGGTGVSYTPNPNYCNNPPGTTLDTFTYTLTPGGSSTTVTVTVTCVDDPPVAVADAATVIEDSGANAIPVLANDTDVDGGPISITSVTQPANGTVVITGGGTGLTYAPSLNYCNDPPGTTPDTFTYTLTPGGSSTTVSVTVTCVNDPPVLTTNPVTYTTPGNTQLHVAGDTLPGVAAWTDAQGATAKSIPTDVDGPGPLQVVAASGSSTNGGSFTIDTDGSFTYVPPVGFSGTDSFTYQVTDNHAPTAGIAIGTVNVTVGTRVWYIRDVTDANNPAGGDGRSTNAFDSVAAFNAATTNDNDIIYVFEGNTATTPHSGSISLKNGQKLWGQGIALDVPGFGTTLVAAANRARIRTTTASTNVVNVPATAGARTNVEIRGLDLEATGATSNAIDVTSSGGNAVGVTISNNNVRGATAEGIDLNAGGTAAFDATVQGNTITAAGNGVDTRVTATGTTTLATANNTITSTGGNAFDARTQAGASALRVAIDSTGVAAAGTGILVDGSAAGTTTITSFANNAVDGNTVGTGISITSATFDGTPGGAFQTVAAGTTMVGASGNGVGAAGIVLSSVQGDLAFTDLDVFADGGAAFSLTGTGAFNSGGSGTRVTVGNAVGTFEATGGPAVSVNNATVDLRLAGMKSTNTPTTGVSLVNVSDAASPAFNAVFSAPAGSSITTTAGATGPIFNVSGGNAQITYAGTITNNSGSAQTVTIDGWSGDDAGDDMLFSGAITSGSSPSTDGGGILLNGNGGTRTIAFSGGLNIFTSGTSTNDEAFRATSNTNTGGVVVTGSANVLNAVSATALRVTSTTIGTSNLNFRTISSGNNTAAADPTNGIVLNATGTQGGLVVTGTGAAGTGGTIQNCTGDGISLTSTSNVSLTHVNVTGNKGSGIGGSSVTKLDLSNLSLQNNTDALVEAGILVTNLGGSNTWSGLTVSGSTEDNIRVNNNTNAVTLTSLLVSGCTVSNNSTGSGNVGINIQASGNATMNGVEINGCALSGNRTVAIRGDAADSSNLAIVVKNNVITAGAPNQGNQGIEIGAATTAKVTSFDVDNNKVGTNGVSSAPLLNTGINISAGGSSGCAMTGHVRNNTVVNAGAGMSGFGIRVFQSSICDIRANVNNNTVSNVGLDYGLIVESGGSSGSTGTVSAAVTNNNVSVLAGALDAIRVQARNASTMCARINTNTTNHPNDPGCGGANPTSFCGLVVRQANTAAFSIEGTGGSCPAGAQTAAQAAACVASQNSEDSVGAFAATNFVGVAPSSCVNIP